jgi:hypothetical protein
MIDDLNKKTEDITFKFLIDSSCTTFNELLNIKDDKFVIKFERVLNFNKVREKS